MYQDIMLATDGSEGARQATEHAIELTRQLEANLHILSVSEDGPHATDTRDEMRHDEEGEAVGAVEAAERTAADAGLDVTSTVRHGVPQEEIVKAAEENPIDLVVVGTVGRSGLDQLVVGSVAEEVVRNSPVPVVVVRET